MEYRDRTHRFLSTLAFVVFGCIPTAFVAWLLLSTLIEVNFP